MASATSSQLLHKGNEGCCSCFSGFWKKQKQPEAQPGSVDKTVAAQTETSQPAKEEKEKKQALKEAQRLQAHQRQQSAAQALVKDIQARLQNVSSDQPLIFAATDVEAWEKDRQKITEIGIAVVEVLPSKSKSDIANSELQNDESIAASCKFRHRHFLIEEHLELRNGKFVADNKDGFLFGVSEVLRLDDAVREVSKELNAANFIVGHAVQGDLEWLRKAGVVGISKKKTSKEDSKIIDTQVLASASEKNPGRSLKALANCYSLEPDNLHNGGNDAAFTLQVMLAQCKFAFDKPARRESQHFLSKSYIAALENAKVRLKAALERHEQLRSEVKTFSKKLEDGLPIAALAFPTSLTAAERKIVHGCAEELGLQSASQDCENGERFVTISAAVSAAAGSAVGEGQHKKHRGKEVKPKAEGGKGKSKGKGRRRGKGKGKDKSAWSTEVQSRG
eukprot:TRINITY_DN12953_c0_g1_i1.p1 TRINITY_DN12953_c0_g1~~TRINITY_DN12953_c0_g1_i1.p1  ORF type:complete len:464 (-),score=125.70 TRINITY_DN12953_c0_g1_i1:46-1392(-)